MQKNWYFSHSIPNRPTIVRMSMVRIILTIALVVCGSYGSVSLNRDSHYMPVGPYFDTIGEYYVEDPILENYADNSDSTNSDYSDADWENGREILNRQLPDSGEYKMNQDKKSQTWCKVKKSIKHQHEPGFDFFPKSYSEYDCISHTNFDSTSDNSIFSSDVCSVHHHGHCVSMQKPFYFLKKKKTEKCWKLETGTVKVGCKCLPHNLK